MKRVALFISSLMAFFSCVKEPMQEISLGESATFDFTLDATMAEFTSGDDADTKASVTTVVRLSWNAGDEISVINLTTGKALGGSLTANETATTTTFSGTLNGTVRSGDKLLFLYPSQGYTEEQDYTPVTVDFSNQQGSSMTGVPMCVYSIVTAGGSNTFSRANATFSFLMSYLQMNLFGLEENAVINSVKVDDIGCAMTIGINAGGISTSSVPGTITMTPPGSYKVKEDGTRAFYMSFAASDAVPARKVTVSTANQYKSCQWTGAKLNNSTSYTSSLSKFVKDYDQSVYEAVDLGLSVKWASFNLGATKPEEYGGYYAWGELSAIGEEAVDNKVNYDYNYASCHTLKYNYSLTYKYTSYDGAPNKDYDLTKYCVDSRLGTVDGLTTLEPCDDAATSNLGTAWRTPSADEWTELINECYWEKVTNYDNSGVEGWVVYKAKNAEDKGKTGTEGNQVTAASYSYKSYDRHIFLPKSGYVTMSSSNPNYADYSYMTSQIDEDSWSTKVFKDTNNNSGRQVVEHYLWRFYCGLPVRPVTSFNKPNTSVDLGLSVNWATCNLGADTPYGYGKYYRFGETKAIGEVDESNTRNYLYNLEESGLPSLNHKMEAWYENYRFCDDSKSRSMAKYCYESENGNVDNKMVLDIEDDAARYSWGGSWRMPSDNEWQELLDNCNWTETTLNGVDGYQVESTVSGFEGKSIFIPKAGELGIGANYGEVGMVAYYWTSDLSSLSSRHAQCFSGIYSEKKTSRILRCYGLPIRPVCD